MNIYQEIEKYCQFNNIEDIDKFKEKCLKQGFDIIKFGLSPFENNRHITEKPKEIKEVSSVEEVKKVETKTEVKPKKTNRKINILDNDLN